ncbi:MAG TPA: ABC transporter ATP-binding protein [Chitinophagaceae bacterium]|jgi:ABC-type multidrug transport system ATPase subunit
MPDAIAVQSVSKRFGDLTAVSQLSFSVPAGCVYGFLGQNGAGKSTMIRMLLTLIAPTAGDIEIFGLNLRRHRKDILRKTGAVIERPDLYKFLSGIENLRLFARMSGVKLTQKELLQQLDRVGLANRADSPVKTYSQGMKQRLGIAVALSTDPDLVILDEPMNGLDPQGIADVRNLILHLSRDLQKTVFVSSHLLNEMELLADAMLIIDKGRKIAEGSAGELFDPAQAIVVVETDNAAAGYEKLKQSSLAERIAGRRNEKIVLRGQRDELPMLMQQLTDIGIPVISIASRYSLEDYFLSLTSYNQHVDTFTN